MSQLSFLLSKRYRLFNKQNTQKFLQNCKVFLFTGAAIIIVPSLIMLSAYDIANRAKCGTSKTPNNKQIKDVKKNSQSNTIIYSSEKQRF